MTTPQKDNNARHLAGLDKGTTISIGLLIVVLGAVVYLSQWMARVDAKLESLDGKISDVRERETADRWRGHDMRVWAASLGAMNPDLKVPVVVRENARGN